MFSKLQIGKEQYTEYELYIKYPMLMSVQFSFVIVSFFVLLIQNSGKKTTQRIHIINVVNVGICSSLWFLLIFLRKKL